MLLRRYGIVIRDLLAREANLPSWRELLMAFRRLEDRGICRHRRRTVKFHACEVLHTGRGAGLIFELNFEFFEAQSFSFVLFESTALELKSPPVGGSWLQTTKR